MNLCVRRYRGGRLVAAEKCLAIDSGCGRGRGVPKSVGSTWEAPKSVGSNGETVFGLKGERAFEVDVWTFNRRCRLL